MMVWLIFNTYASKLHTHTLAYITGSTWNINSFLNRLLNNTPFIAEHEYSWKYHWNSVDLYYTVMYSSTFMLWQINSLIFIMSYNHISNSGYTVLVCTFIHFFMHVNIFILFSLQKFNFQITTYFLIRILVLVLEFRVCVCVIYKNNIFCIQCSVEEK